MDLPWGSPEATAFVTNVGLITSNGPHGHNIMAAEWTHHVSYAPGLIAVCIGHQKATLENIRATKEFGVSLAAADQNILASVAGGSSGRDADKVAALRELGVRFTEGKKTGVLLVDGATLRAECAVTDIIPIGDHAMVVGEVVELHPLGTQEPLLYHKLAYWHVGAPVQKPAGQKREQITQVVEKHRKR